jgi:hypothetical protein
MNSLKRNLGIVWMLMGPAALIYLIQTALEEISRKPVIDTQIQWAVFIIIFLPIAFGMVLFGYFAWKGDYDHLPESSDEIND